MAKRLPRWLRILGWTVAWPLLLASLVVGGVWLWAGSGESLAVALARAARHLPEGQTLETSEVTGSLRSGGRIGLLRWRGAGLIIEAREVEVGWRLPELWQRKLVLSHLQAAQLSVEQTQSGTDEPFAVPEHIVLPIEVDIPFKIGSLQWKGPPALEASGLAGRYAFDGKQHALQLDGLQIAAGSYQGRANLQAQAPLELGLDVQAQVQATVPDTTRTLTLSATVAARGHLGGPDAALAVQAELRPAPGADTGQAGQAMQAKIDARIHPWAAQPVEHAEAVFRGIDAAAFWPGAPRTLLSGTVKVQPMAASTGTGANAGAGWQAQGQVANGAAGPWDRGRVPVDQAEARLRYAQGAWQIESLAARAGPGDVLLQGQWQPGTPARWQVSAELRRIDPARLHTQFAPASLGGRVQARSEGRAIVFDADVRPDERQPKASPLQGLRLREVVAQGRWAEPTLSLQVLRLRTDDAHLEGQLDAQLRSRAARGELRLDLPGAQASVQGHLSADQGEGTLSLRVADAAKAARWIAQWPGMPALPAGTSVQGEAELSSRWQGGWNSLQAAPGRGPVPGLQARLSVPRLDVASAGQPPDKPLRVRDLRIEANGPLSAVELVASGHVASGTARIDLQTRATAGRTAAGDWQARFAQLALKLQDGARPGVWSAQLSQPVSASFRPTTPGFRLETSAGELALNGPAPGTARIVWQPLSWRMAGHAAAGSAGSAHELRSQGRIEDLPMAWLDALAAAGGGPLANVGLAGDMVFGGTWDLLAADTLRLQATLERRSGDIRVLGEEAGGEPIQAGVKQASARLSTEGETVRASLRWDSERAGQVQADLSTRMARADGAWLWPEDAPLAGKLEARLPRIGTWSMLAPPGWRMRGTLEADATLAGTRRAPLWNGQLRADDLALRSVVDGIELRDGRLRAALQGQRLELTELALYGAPTVGGAPTSGGSMSATGSASWAAEGGVRADVVARARALRVSIRTDRQLTVSGELQVHAEEKKLSLRGQLQADHALFVLPDETTPSLGSDVVVRSAATRARDEKAAAALAEAKPGLWKADMTVAFALGDDFRIRGRGLATQLTGALELSSSAGAAAAPLRVSGEVRTVRGSYRAYGQSLDIEQGVLRFGGAYDNPSLDVLAIRPNLTQRVGVQITGTALAPRVRLYAEPELPDTEKLAWLVLGRSAASGGAEAAVLQQAALALLGGNGRGLSGGLAEALGLDELSFRGASSQGDNGSATTAAVTLGKRLSRNFYVAYERSLAGTLGSFYIFYDLSRRLTLRAQTGEKSAVDLIFTIPYD